MFRFIPRGIHFASHFGFFVGCNSHAAVSGLHLCVSPSAIQFGVVAAGVNSVERRSYRPLAHVLKKIRKNAPSFIERHARRSITSIVRVFGVATPLDHGIPTLVGAGSSQTVRACSLKSNLTFEATARSNGPRSQAIHSRNVHVAAIAATLPKVNIPSLLLGAAYRCGFPKPLICNVFAHGEGIA